MKRAVVENRATPTNKSYKTLEHKFHPNLHLVFFITLGLEGGLKKASGEICGDRKEKKPKSKEVTEH